MPRGRKRGAWNTKRVLPKNNRRANSARSAAPGIMIGGEKNARFLADADGQVVAGTSAVPHNFHELAVENASTIGAGAFHEQPYTTTFGTSGEIRSTAISGATGEQHSFATTKKQRATVKTGEQPSTTTFGTFGESRSTAISGATGEQPSTTTFGTSGESRSTTTSGATGEQPSSAASSGGSDDEDKEPLSKLYKKGSA